MTHARSKLRHVAPLLRTCSPLLLLFLFFSGLFPAIAFASVGSAVVVLKEQERTLDDIHIIRKTLERRSQVTAFIPPKIFLIEVTPKQADIIRGNAFVAELSFNSFDSNHPQGKQAKRAIETWNNILAAKGTSGTTNPLSVHEENKSVEPLPPFEIRREKEAKYHARWSSVGGEISRSILEASGLIGSPSSSEGQEPEDPSELGLYSTSSYFTGDIAVGVFYVPGDNGEWPSEGIPPTFGCVVDRINTFALDEPNADITFTFTQELDESGVPLPAPQNDDQWREYVNDLRNSFDTDWAFGVVISYEAFTGASAHGTGILISSLGDGKCPATKHETAHVFGALDQYDFDGGNQPTRRGGYLNVVNANSDFNDGAGYFDGAGENVLDLMVQGDVAEFLPPIGVYTRGQIGWRDSNGDGILDPLDTYPDTVIGMVTGSHQFSVTGYAKDRALPNEMLFRPDAAVNSISRVQYRINNSSWFDAEPYDGTFNEPKEQFSFVTPELPNGIYDIDVRSNNSQGNFGPVSDSRKLKVRESSIVNAFPMAQFSVSPEEGSINSVFRLDASSSFDIEDSLSAIEARWDFEGDGTWNTGWSKSKIESISFREPGPKTVHLEVRDTNGLTSQFTRTLSVASANLPPIASFTVTPENGHGQLPNGEFSFAVLLDASSTSDAEDDPGTLQYRWDFNRDGQWDTAYQNSQTTSHEFMVPIDTEIALVGEAGLPGALRGAVSGDYLYVISDELGLVAVDIADRENPSVVSVLNLNTPLRAIATSGQFAYLTTLFSGLLVIDCSNPEDLQHVATADVSDFLQEVTVVENIAFVAAGFNGLYLVDVSNPENPEVTGSVDIGTFGVDTAIWGSYAYVHAVDHLVIVDISDHSTPVVVNSIEVFSGLPDVEVSNSHLYIDNDVSGLAAYSLSQPDNPTLVGSLNLNDNMARISIESNTAFVLGVEKLYLIETTDPSSLSVIGSIPNDEIKDIVWDGSTAFVIDSNVGIRAFEVTDNVSVAPRSVNWRVTLEVLDSAGASQQATRDVWIVTYNSPPQIESISDIEVEPVAVLEIVTSIVDFVNATDIAVSGSIAYVADRDDGFDDLGKGVQVVDVSIPTSPVLLGSVDTPGSVRNVTVDGSYVYASLGDDGIQIVDVSDPYNPSLVGSFQTGIGTLDVAIQGTVLYAAAWTSGLYILDIIDPLEPELIGTYEIPSVTNSVDIIGKVAIAATNEGLRFIDVSDPSTPSELAFLPLEDRAHNVTVSGNYAYVSANNAGLKVIDVSELSNPIIVGSYATPSRLDEVAIQGNHAFLAGSNAGVLVLDISNPAAPSFISSLDSFEETRGIAAFNDALIVADTYALHGMQVIEGGITSFTVDTFDPDENTSWDGTKELRLDFGNDGIFETEFHEIDGSGFSSLLTMRRIIKDSPVRVQIADRFGAITQIILCDEDLNNDGLIDVQDLLILIGAWESHSMESGDINGDGQVDVSDLTRLITAWGECGN